MWFKIVLSKDGSVSSCEQVAESFEGSRQVIYIEAASKAQALNSMRLRRNVRKLTTDSKLRNLDLCLDCRRPTGGDRVRCAACLARRKEDAKSHVRLTPAERSAKRQNRPHTNNERLVAFYECRQAYDKNPKGFRVWLQARIDACYPKKEAG